MQKNHFYKLCRLQRHFTFWMFSHVSPIKCVFLHLNALFWQIMTQHFCFSIFNVYFNIFITNQVYNRSMVINVCFFSVHEKCHRRNWFFIMVFLMPFCLLNHFISFLNLEMLFNTRNIVRVSAFRHFNPNMLNNPDNFTSLFSFKIFMKSRKHFLKQYFLINELFLIFNFTYSCERNFTLLDFLSIHFT